ncbi:MAG: transposase [Candidatus Nanopelagicales bacterium]
MGEKPWQVRYTYRLRPGAVAERYLVREAGMCRFVWNQLVARSRDLYEWNRSATLFGGTDPATFGYAAQDKFLTWLRATTVDPESGELWLAAGSSVAQQQTVRDFAAARTKALQDRMDRSIPASRKRGLPRFKSRHTALPSMNYTTRGFSLVERDGRVRLQLPGKVTIPVVWSQDLPSQPTSMRVYQDSIGHWYASFCVTVEPDAGRLPPVGHSRAIGIDWGITETATTATVDLLTGEIDDATTYDLPHHQHGRNAAARLARYQRQMARRRQPKGKPATRGYENAKRRAAKAHKKVARQRKDDAAKWARNVVADHHLIAVEDFKPKFLAKSTMARKAADAAIAATKTQLLWQARKAGRRTEPVHPAYTTTDCSTCGARTKHRLPLGERTYTCERCGMVRPRDKNSATIMVARAGFSPADAEGVSPAPAAARAPAA